ncbi:MAG TPA: pyruvoyl-dependent arginine decarboxylase, partial [Microthrixaceae bacterium]|nr:pyruvoyl-dependent arginine decarboxylase [Microthrixaceae bacterium]
MTVISVRVTDEVMYQASPIGGSGDITLPAMGQTFNQLVDRQQAATNQLTINVSGSVGHGPTSLSAFDSALAGAGVSNFNLIRLSSVIPPNSIVSGIATTESEIIDLRSVA